MFEHTNNPIVIAHRGSSAYAPENTIAAFTLAVHQGADAIELDAKLSLDETVVVIHDQTLERTTDGNGNVRDFSVANLKEFDAGTFFDETFTGEKIPTLNEVFEIIGDKVLINVELTNYATPFDNLPYKVADLIQTHKLEQNIICSSFNPVALFRIKKVLPDLPIGLLAFPGRKGWWIRKLGRWLPIQTFHPCILDMDSNLINKYHKRGIQVFCYTVNDPGKLRMLCSWNINGIFTDDPPLALKIVSE